MNKYLQSFLKLKDAERNLSNLKKIKLFSSFLLICSFLLTVMGLLNYSNLEAKERLKAPLFFMIAIGSFLFGLLLFAVSFRQIKREEEIIEELKEEEDALSKLN